VKSFTLELLGHDELTRALLASVREAGCDDTFVYERDGRVFMDCTRDRKRELSGISTVRDKLRSVGIETLEYPDAVERVLRRSRIEATVLQVVGCLMLGFALGGAVGLLIMRWWP
jgi:hypothetical protein